MSEVEFRAYHDSDGNIVTYTTEKLEGDYIVITAAEYSVARHDAKVISGRLVYQNRRNNHTVLVRRKGTPDSRYVSKHDMSIVLNQDELDDCEFSECALEIYNGD